MRPDISDFRFISELPAFKITIAYDGTDFVGWQRQATGVSVQGLLEDALAELDEGAVTVVGAGRTDAGVHALGQVAAFTVKRTIAGDAVVRALNVRLPETVRVLEADEVSAEFHPQFAARSKTYRYRIWNGGVLSPFERRYAWHVIGALDVGAMEAAARFLEGTHDFAGFRATGSEVKTTVRHVMSSRVGKSSTTEDTDRNYINGGHGSLDRSESVASVDMNLFRDLRGSAFSGHLITYEITGDGFLRHMVRTIVGTLVEIGRGRRAPGWISELVASRDRSLAGPTAPPHGLFLTRVDYQTPGAPCE